jgi:hypothetical protein
LQGPSAKPPTPFCAKVTACPIANQFVPSGLASSATVAPLKLPQAQNVPVPPVQSTGAEL